MRKNKNTTAFIEVINVKKNNPNGVLTKTLGNAQSRLNKEK